MTEQKLRTFKLIDREGFINSNFRNREIIESHMENGVFEGIVDEDCCLIPIVTPNEDVLILGNEFKFFEEIFEDEGEEMVEDKKIIKKYIREEFNTRGQALDSYDSGVVFYTPSNEGYSVVDESGILENFGQLFTLEEREETWQDVAQEFIKSNPVFDEDEFLLEMFSDDYSEYHKPMKQLAKIIVEKSGN